MSVRGNHTELMNPHAYISCHTFPPWNGTLSVNSEHIERETSFAAINQQKVYMTEVTSLGFRESGSSRQTTICQRCMVLFALAVMFNPTQHYTECNALKWRYISVHCCSFVLKMSGKENNSIQHAICLKCAVFLACKCVSSGYSRIEQDKNNPVI